MAEARSELPGVLAEIAELIGEEAALALAKAFGGTTVLIRKSVVDGDPMAAVVGLEAARRISREIGWGNIEIPLARHWMMKNEILRLLDQKLSESAIARAVGCHGRTVRRHRRLRRLRRLQRWSETAAATPPPRHPATGPQALK